MKRFAGVLLSVTSLPSKYGIGCFSKEAYKFVDWLAEAGQRYWQILPLGATSRGGSDSPYQAYSAFAGNPYMICLETLIEEGVLTAEECDTVDWGQDSTMVDYALLYEHRFPLLRKAYERSNISQNADYQRFIRDNAWWLDDYALFMALKNFFGEDTPWRQWPEDIRMHWGFALDYYRGKLYYDVEFQKYIQYKFCEQWMKLKAYANERHIQIVGDIPIYVSPDGADVWAHPELFQLNANNEPTQVAGCPPDAFAADGQLWGNPLYRWEYHRHTGYEWWVSRMWYSFQLYDVMRLDHFRGFDEYFAIPADSKTALNGHWEQGPGMELFWTLRHRLGERSIIAEDLGTMTDSVRRLVKDSGFPNMKVLQFAFEDGDTGGACEHLPHNYGNNCVVYTGTHDNETIVGWWEALSTAKKAQVREYMDMSKKSAVLTCRSIVTLGLRCAADTCIVPVQDWLGLDNSCRMNQPGTVDKNWRWRLTSDQITEELADEMLALVKRYGRANWDCLKFIGKEKD